MTRTIPTSLEQAEPTPHPAAARPPSPSRGEGKTAADGSVPSPSPLEGEGARRADEGLLQPVTDDEALATMAQRDQARSHRARPEWRTNPIKRLRGFARNMRSAPTEAERRLWALVRDRRLEPYKFRRQVPIGRYIADLLCPEKMLIVELDGSQHAESAGDVVRDAWFAEQGYRTLRFWNGDVLARPVAVLETILAHIEYGEPTPHPAAARPPSPSRGEGKEALR